jgi:hypothetical protein
MKQQQNNDDYDYDNADLFPFMAGTCTSKPVRSHTSNSALHISFIFTLLCQYVFLEEKCC